MNSLISMDILVSENISPQLTVQGSRIKADKQAKLEAIFSQGGPAPFLNLYSVLLCNSNSLYLHFCQTLNI